MNILLDTHTFLWFVAGSGELSQRARQTIEDPANIGFISIASLWEISIKTTLGKLTIKGKYETVIDDVTSNGFMLLPIEFHTVQQNKPPFHHKDPFDRVLVSQAIIENMELISKDEIFDPYLASKKIA
ncbi:MAG: type II toxin-antitoxin system VapC family toxin [Saprospiraceae bacterium]